MNGGMKVPIYQRQTQLTRDSGARPLSAMASPGAYAGPANAAFGMGKAISGAGEAFGDIVVAEMRQESATMLASEESKFADAVFNVKTDAVAGPIGQSKMVPNPNPSAKLGPRPGNLVQGPAETQQEHLARYRSVLTRRAAAQASRITNSNVRRQFRADADSKIQTAMSAIQTQLRVRYLDRSRAVLDNTTIAKRREINQVAFNSPTRQTLINGHINKIIEDGRANGEKETEIESRVRKFESSTIEDYINSEMIAAAETDDLNRIKQLQLQVQNSNNGTSDFYGLLPDISLRLEKRLSDLYEREDRRIDSDAEKKERTDRKGGENEREDLFRKTVLKIDTARARGEAPEITAADINALTVDPNHKRLLLNMRFGTDVIYNGGYVRDANLLLTEAVTDDDIQDVLHTARNDRNTGLIGNKAFSAIEQTANDAIKKTPEYIEKKRYRKYLEDAFGISQRRYAPQGAARNQNVIRAKEAALMLNYEEFLEKGYRPAQAAFTVLAARKKEDTEAAQNLYDSLPRTLLRGVFPDDAEETLTVENIEEKIQKIKNNWRAQFSALPFITSITTSEQLRELQTGAEPGQPLSVKSTKGKERKITLRQRKRARALFNQEQRINAIFFLIKGSGAELAVAAGNE
tara:strand:- start:3251 stop:5152 length:1902 start_codon:yes stop_codon:yes gene_type:complete